MNPQSASSHIVLDKDELKKNMEFVRSKLKKGVNLSAVIKGNAYGHGIAEVVPLMEEEGVNHFSVYGIEEAMVFHDHANPGSQLMIMGYIDPENLDWTLRKGYEFFIYDLVQLRHAIGAAKEIGVEARIHIEVETGMNRTGLDENALDELVKLIETNREHLRLIGICTHLAGAESISNYYRIKQQMTRFKRYLKYFQRKGIEFEVRHMACSAALIRYPSTQYDMVRSGILLYGFWPSRETLIDYLTKTKEVTDPLTSILTWKSRVMTVKDVDIGEYVGYGTSFLTNRKTKIAIVPVGYGYGYSRTLSNQGRVLVNGQRVAVIGMVNMNMMAIDISEVEGVVNGSEVVLIGFQGDNRITVASFGEMSSQLNYELLARLPQRIPRIIKE
jgi:alanine racemase